MSLSSYRNHVYAIGDEVVFRRAGRGFGRGHVHEILESGVIVVSVPDEGFVEGEPGAFRPCGPRAA